MDSSSVFSSQLIDTCKRALSSRGGLDLITALAFQRRQALRRKAAERRGLVVPPVLIASITRRCNLDCEGCYAKSLRPVGALAPAELPDDRLMALLEEAVELGVGVVMLAGGEPLLRQSLLERVAAIRGLMVPVFTNGTLVDSRNAHIFGSGLIPVFSIEGDSAFTSDRRGAGVHESVLRGIEAVRAAGGAFGLSITVTSRNAELVLSPAFLAGIDALGPAALFLVEYVPAAPGTDALVLGEGQRARLNDPALAEALRAPLVRLPGDEEAYGGCMAAGRGFIHLSPEGALEACPFAPYSDSDAGRSGLREALASPLMRAIRERHGELKETRGGCALRGKAGWVASLGACVRDGAHAGALDRPEPAANGLREPAGAA